MSEVNDNIPNMHLTELIESDIVDDSPVPQNKPEGVEEQDVSNVKKNAVIVEHPCIDETEILDTDTNTVLPSGFKVDTDRIEQNISNGGLTSAIDHEKGREWFAVLKAGSLVAPAEDIFKDTVDDPSALFEQVVKAPAGGLTAGVGRFKATSNEVLKGDRAVLRAMSHLGLGSTFRVPLWNSGFWITLRAPSEPDILELQRVLIDDKIMLGRSSYGMIHSNITSYVVQRLLDFALSHLHQTTIEVPNDKDIRDFISCHDIPTIVWGIACAIWPQGFKFQRSCISSPEKCQHTVIQKLKLGKILWTNTNSLSEWQIAHMSSVGPASKKAEDVLRYQSESLKAQKREVVINKGQDSEFKIVLKTPTAEQYIDSGARWISGIVDIVNRAISNTASINEKNNYITKRGKATTLRQYGHWVDKIELGDNNTIEDTETIESTLNVFSSDDKVREEIIKAVTSYIASSTLTVIGIPSYDCPVCGTDQTPAVELPNHTNIIPVDVYTTFFTLLVQKLEKIEQR